MTKADSADPRGDGDRPLNVVLAAEEAAGLQVFKKLVAGRHHVVAVLTTEPRAGDAGRGANLWSFAAKLGHRTLPARMVKDPALATLLREERTDVLLNVHSLHMIRSEVIEAPRIGSFNLHPGPLPRYAGLDAPSWALFHGEKTHGVTLHWMVPTVDAGPIAYQRLFDIAEQDTGLTVSVRCVREGLPLIASLLAACAASPGSIPRIAQDLSRREVFGRKPPGGGFISWERPASEIRAFLRAADFHPFPSPWGHAKARLGDRELEVVRARVAPEPPLAAAGTVTRADGEGAVVACGEGSLLLTLVRLDGKFQNAGAILARGTILGNGG